MEKKSLLHLAVILFLTQAIFSCSSAEYYRFAPVKQEAYKPLKAKPAPVAAEQASNPSDAKTTIATVQSPTTPELNLEASVAPTAPVKIRQKPMDAPILTPAKSPEVNAPALTSEESKTLALVQDRLANLTKAEKKEFKTNIKDVLQQNASGSNIVEIIFAILIPPVGVFLHEGITNRFWISLLLTILFFVPGMIYALLVVTDTI